MTDVSTINDSYRRLHRAGWSIGSKAFTRPDVRVWLISGHRGLEKRRRSLPAEKPGRRDLERQKLLFRF